MLYAIASKRLLSTHSVLLHNIPKNLIASFSLLRHYHQPIEFHQPSSLTHDDPITSFDDLLRQCATIQHCKQIHTHVLVSATHKVAFLSARVVSVYASFGYLFDAQKVFDCALSECASSLLLWNSILRAYVSRCCYGNALKLFVKMLELGVSADGFTLPLVTRACGFMGSSRLCRIVHGIVIEMGFEKHLHVGNELVGMYGKLGQMWDAQNVFDRMVVRSHVSWNMMVSGYSINYDCDGALDIFRRMEAGGLEPNLVTWTSLLSSHARCGKHEETLELFSLMRIRGAGVTAGAVAVVLSVYADLGNVDRGKVIHGYAKKAGLEDFAFVKNALISVYGKQGDLNDAHSLFQEIERKTIVTWNALMSSYAETGLLHEALILFSQLETSDTRPNTVTWTILIDGFALKGQGKESLGLFRKMQSAKVVANAVTVANILSVCAELAAVNLGKEIHCHVIRAYMDKNILVENALVNMYMRCGCLKVGQLIFEKIERKDDISWNTMITGYGMHGYGKDALETFNQMIKSGSKPNAITFVGVISACSHARLVPEGRRIFYQMFGEHGIEPKLEHYACMVDLLGRAGLLQEASLIVKNMPMEPNAYVWSALLNSCRIHKNMEIAEETASHIFSLSKESTGSYMLLSNIYAASGRWEDCARVRASVRMKGFKKNPGQSWIEVKKNIYIFLAGNSSEKGLQEVYEILEELAIQMEGEGHCIPDNSNVLQSFDDSILES